MASAQLTDEELVSELKRLGFTPGPVTESTRPVYLKKLKKLREEQPQLRGSRSGKGRSSSGTINNNGSGASSNSSSAARAPGFSARPPTSDVTRLSASRSEKRKAGKFVLGFSSDESDVEAPQKKGGPNHGGSRRDRGSAQQTPTIRPAGTPAAAVSLGLSADRKSVSGSPWWADRGKSGDLAETERDSRAVNGNKAFYESNSSKLARDYSDSDEEEEEVGERDRPRERRLTSRHSPPASSSPYRSAWSSDKTALGAHDTPDYNLDMVGERRDEDDKEPSEFSGSYVSRSYPKLSGTGRDDNSGGSSIPSGSFHRNHLDNGDGESACSSRFSIGLRPRFPSYTATYRANHSNHTGSNHSYSHASAHKSKQHTTVPEDELLQQFKREEVSSTGGFSAHYLSMFLLTAACLFFVLLGLMYLRMRGSGTAVGDAVIMQHPFGAEFDKQYDVKERELILNLLLSLHEHLASVAGEHDCGDFKNPLNRSVSFSDASKYLKLQNEAYENLIETSLEWVMKTKDVVGIRLIGGDPDHPIEDVSEISRLESIHPRMSFFCRFRRAFFTVIYRVLLILAGIGVVVGLVYYMKYRWRKEEEETRHMYDMVERIIDVLRSHNEACQENKDLQAYLPIPHVRDSLVQPQERKRMKKVWDRAVSFLSANESRIRTEKQRIGGADFMVWRWLQPSMSPDKMCNMPSKVWQGQAFPLDRRNSPPNSLTPCLKIRNMFDPVMEVGENWHLAIQEAILEKCSDNDGIVHIAVDKNSREGCVYVKCLSAEHSGKAFKALHGSWFDGKLVTVKYLRLDRYHQRFPQALGSNTPLKPSSSSMNSMSRLNQRSSTSSLKDTFS
ncbi:inner nuclear membrane protein Man1 [Danio rerio]|uniref:Inner nuclear membrane protein Man1 n=1 Tax=Danio rerio TaxID=7955 RepID=Q5TZH9_DANRE|nr:inner nuclear membrane protein Man1 [Danio rerio]AAI68502.1 LEM domain containing 3 [Danio rerio]|eukprot:NP_001038329.1 inner nuclear membrane protein Man1 [Danio rerio]